METMQYLESAPPETRPRTSLFRIPAHYLAVAAFVLVFSLIYGHFSHGVHSVYMSAAFLIPVFGAVLSLLLTALHGGVRPSARAALFAGILTLTTGSIVEGIFRIAGTSSPYMLFYPVAGLALTAFAILLWRPRT